MFETHSSPLYRVCVVGLLLLVVFSNVALACPTCKDGMTQDKNQANMVRGYGLSIVFMMSMPFLIFAGLGAYFYLLVRRARAEREADVDLQINTGGSTVPVKPAELVEA